jgi:hypothetical protein
MIPRTGDADARTAARIRLRDANLPENAARGKVALAIPRDLFSYISRRIYFAAHRGVTSDAGHGDSVKPFDCRAFDSAHGRRALAIAQGSMTKCGVRQMPATVFP